MRIAVITAGLSDPSSTRLLADQLADSARRALVSRGVIVKVDVIELRPLAHALADNLMTGFPTGALAEAVATVEAADALITVTPVFTASYSGLFKTFFDVLDKDLLVGKPVQIAATAGTARHSLVLDHAVRPLFAYLRAVVLPTAVFAASEDFGSTSGGQLAERVERAGRELADHLVGHAHHREVDGDPLVGASEHAAGNGQQLAGRGGRKAPRDEFADPTPFEDLLASVR